jgi:hypothetical protein
LTLSLGNPASFHNLQPKAAQLLIDQFDNPQLDNAAWKGKMDFIRKVTYLQD